MTLPKLLFLVTEDSYFHSHRLPMARAGQRAGYDVAVVTNASKYREAIEGEGIRVIPLSLERRSLNPFRAVKHVRLLAALYRREKPALVHHIAMKPVLFGSLAAWMAGVPHVVNAFAGLGYVFVSDAPLARLLRPALTAAFRILLKRRGSHLLLQNDDDLALLRRLGLAPEGRVTVIKGSGVDMEACRELPFPPAEPDFICAYAGRMVGIKGLQTLKEASLMLSDRAPHIRLWLCGAPDPANPGSWTEAQLKAWVAESDNVSYQGHCGDMRAVWAKAHAALQPSWGGEGVPKSLLEAAACGRAIIATDVPGCREVVDEGRNGFLVPPRDAEALARAVELLAADPERCAQMGSESRKLVGERGLSARDVSARAEQLYRGFLSEV